MSLEDAPSLDSMFRIQTLLFLRDNIDRGISGYDLMLEIEKITGKKPSAGKLYPFLKQLAETNYLEVSEDGDTSRNKTQYKLTEKGVQLVDEVLDRMRNLLDARTDLLLETCYHCGVTLYETQVSKIDKDGIERKFCCVHCMNAPGEPHSH